MRDLQADLAKRKAEHLYRQRRIAESPQGVRMRIDGRELISFCSNDYLGLANDPDVIKSFQQAANEFGVGAGAAHLINGHSRYHHELEEALADFTGRESALLFSTGYMANLGVVQALLGRHDRIYADKLNHASLLDAAKLSGAKLKRYPHADMEILNQMLGEKSERDSLIMTDGVFSMDGDIADLTVLAKLASQNHSWFMVDDAHGFGVLGEHGGGCVEHFGLDSLQVPLLIGTLGKAFGTAGAFVAGDADLVDYLIQTARTYIYTTAMPAAIAAATLTSLEKIRNGQRLRDKLQKNISRFRNNCKQSGITCLPSSTAIQGIVTGSSETALAFSNYLISEGFLVTAIRPPTVPAGTARLRITLSVDHSSSDIDRLIQKVVNFS